MCTYKNNRVVYIQIIELETLFQDICEAARFYADDLEKKLKRNNYYDDNPSYFGVSESVRHIIVVYFSFVHV